MDKGKNFDELIIANKEIAFLNQEKENFVNELKVAYQEIAILKEEKKKQATELLIANRELTFLNSEQYKLFTSVVNSSEDAILSKTLDGVITSWNPGAEKIFGYSADEIIGKHAYTLIPHLLQNEEAEIVKKIRNGEKVENYETERVRKDGTFFFASLNTYPIKDFEGNITGASEIMRDISEHKNALRALQIREERFRVLLENNPAIISLNDDSLNFIYRSPSSTRVTGWTDDDMKTSAGINRVHPDDLNIVQAAVAEAIKNPGIPQPYRSRYLHKNGHYIWLEGKATKLQDETIAKGIIFNSWDVTEKIELEDLLLKASKLARIGSWNVDLIKQTVYWNDITREIHEADKSFIPDLTSGLNFYKEGPGRELITQKVKEAIELGKPWDEELEIVTVKNNVRWIRTIGETEFVDGKCVKIYGSFQDIDQRKKAEEQIKESEEKQKTILQSLLDNVVILNADGEIQYINHVSPGLTKKEVLGSNWLQWLHKEDQTEANEAIGLTLSTGNFSEIQVRSIGPERKMTWFNIKIVLMSDVSIQQVLLVATNITEQKNSEETIRLSEIRLLKAQEIGKFGYWHQDINSDNVWASKEAMRIYGFANEEGELQRATIAACIIDLDKVKEAAVNLVEHGKEYNIDIRINPADGSPMKYISALAELEKNEQGEPVRIVGTLQDITDRKKAVKTEYELHTRLKAIFENTNDAIMLADDNGNYVNVNPATAKMLGYSQQELTGMNATDIISGRQTDELWNEFMQDGSQTGAIELVRKDGSLVICHYNATSNILPGLHLSILTDITERKKAENKLRENENYLRTILDTEPECVKVLNSKGELISMNPAGLAMIEADNEQQVLGHLMTELVNEKYRFGFNRLSKEVFNGNSGTLEFEIIGLKGGHRWLETHAVPLKDAEGKVINLLGVTRDITQRKKAEEAITNTTEELRQLTAHLQSIREEERKRIAREIHDELGQQLTAIKMDTVWIDKQIPAESVSIKNKLKNMIELLDGSHQSVRKILNELRPAALDDNGLLETMVWLGKQFTEASNTPVNFTSNQPTFKLPQETAICIFRVYQEALTNIMRYAEASKVVSTLNIINNSIVLTIQDDGKGFNTEAVKSKNSFGLLGMKERVYSLNGTFDLISLPEKGSTIVINLPYVNAIPA